MVSCSCQIRSEIPQNDQAQGASEIRKRRGHFRKHASPQARSFERFQGHQERVVCIPTLNRKTRFGSDPKTLPKTAADDSDIELGYGLK